MKTWQIEEAKEKLGDVIEAAITNGCQTITRHGTECAVVLSVAEYKALTEYKPDLRDYLLGGPKVDSFDIDRDFDTGSEIDL